MLTIIDRERSSWAGTPPQRESSLAGDPALFCTAKANQNDKEEGRGDGGVVVR